MWKDPRIANERNKVSGADVGVGFRSVIVRIEVEETIVRVRIIVAAHLSDTIAGVRVDVANATTGPHCADDPAVIIDLFTNSCAVLGENNKVRYF